MSQWGQRLAVAGGEFIPLVAGQPFEPVNAEHEVIDVICVDIAGDGARVRRALDRLKRRHIGKEYQRWLDAAPRWRDSRPPSNGGG